MITAYAAAMLLAAAYPASKHYVYAFTIDAAPSERSGDGGKRDRGTIDADVLAVQADSGTVVRISEQSRARPALQAATCVAYGTGLVQCDAIGNVTVEEMSLLRLLGRGFLNFGEVDRQRGWHNGASDGRARESNDYRITSESKGEFEIAFQRVLNVPGFDGYVSTTTGSLSYDQQRSAPTSLKQQTITKPQAGTDDPIVEDLTLTLQSGSLLARPA